jgi:hypothetical protein
MSTFSMCLRAVQTALFAACVFLCTSPARGQTLPLDLRCPTNVTLWTCTSNAVWQTPLPVPSGGCSNYTVICTPPVGATLPLGVHTVTCRVFDACQNTDTCTFTITVRRDTEPPVITCPSNMLVRVCPTAAGGCGGVVNYPPPVATDNSGVVTVSCNPPSGTFLACGVYTVTCTAFDRCQNRDTCEFIIRVEPGDQPPSIQCPPDQTILTCSNSAVLLYPAPVVNPPGTTVVCVPPPGVLRPLGSHAVTCIASNQCGTVQCSFKVEVRPVPPPTITCPSNITITLPCPSNCIQVAYAPPTVVNGTLVGCSPPPGGCLTPGITTVTCLATNRCGDRDICSFEVRVIQGQGPPPQIICPNDMTVTTCSNTCQVVTYPAPVVVNGVLVKCTPPSGSCFPIGVNTVVCEASNACGRVECSFDITVRRVPPPSILCPTNELTFTMPCNSNCVPVTYGLLVSGGEIVACTPPSGTCLPAGLHTITCIATNICGDRDICQFRVRVVPGQGLPPQMICPNDITVTTCSNCVVVNYALPIVNNGVLIGCNPPPTFCFPIGTTTVTCEASNACARAECKFNVIVRPVPPPTILCPSNVVVTLPCGSNCVPVVYPPLTVNNGTLVGCNPPSGTCFPAGNHIVICRATNICGVVVGCEFPVRVIQGQGEPPRIICPTNILTFTVPCGSNCVPVFYPLPPVLNGVLVGCNPPPGTCLPVGLHTITCVATNDCERDTCTFQVRVIEGQGQPPRIICPTNILTFTVPCGSNCVPVFYPLPPVINGVLVGCNPPPGTCLPVGLHTITCTATNNCERDTCTFQVRVIEGQGQPPRIICPTNILTFTVTCGSNCVTVFYPLPPVLNGVLVGCNPPPGTCLPVGLHTITCVATNQCERDTCTFQVRVVQGPDQPPIIRCPQDITVVACSNDCEVVHYPPPVVIGGVLVKCEPPSGTCFPIGVTTVNCVASNSCGRSECKFDVRVLRPGRPVLSIKRDGHFVVICWPKTCECYKLQSTRSLNPPRVWTDVPVVPDDHGDSWCVRLPIEPRHRFFRLIKCDQPTAPVFGVAGLGITADQGGLLAGALNIPRGDLHQDEGGGLLFIDPLKFQAIPTKPIDDPALIEELRRGSENDGRSELSFDGIDFEGLRRLRVLEGEKAVDVWEHALRQAGVEPGTGENVARHTTFEAMDVNGRPMMEETMLDTHVFFQFDLGGLPLIGPGANLRVAFGPDGAPTSLQAAFRKLSQQGETPVLSLDEAARRCAERYPSLRGKIRPQLAYYAPSLLLPAVQKVLPCFICAGDASVDGQQVSLLQSIIPASEDPELTPSVSLEASAQGSLVKAKATAAGGTPPYSYEWSSSSRDLSGVPATASEIEYEAAPRAEESSETVKVIVTDANGIQALASQTVEIAGGAGGLLFTAAVGGVSDYGCERGVSDLCAAQQAAFNARFALDGYTRRFNWAASTAWERDFKQGGTGLDHLYVDNVDMTFYMGHGSGQGFTFENNNDDTLLRYSDVVGDWGNVDLEWLALLSCSVIADSWGGLNWAQRWGPTFDGMHLLLGFSNTAYDEAGFGNAFAQWMLGYRIGLVTLPPVPIRSAWFLAKDSNQPSSVIACTMGVLGPSGLSNYNDYFWGKGSVGPDVRGANIHGYWRVSHP